VPRAVQAALYQLSRSAFFAGLAERALIWDLKQVRRYLSDSELRQEARDRVRAVVGSETRVVVAHSLGSVVAYEVLCSMPDHQVKAFVTLGSPLGIPNLIFDRLDPLPFDGVGRWPGSRDLVWTNIADRGDIVALVKDLRSVFGPDVRNALVHNDVHAHDADAYLTDRLTGAVIAEGLAAGE